MSQLDKLFPLLSGLECEEIDIEQPYETVCEEIAIAQRRKILGQVVKCLEEMQVYTNPRGAIGKLRAMLEGEP